MYIPIDKLRQYFSDGKRPNGEQFYELIKSLWHKSEKIPFENIKGLSDAVNSIKFEGAKTYQTKAELLAVSPIPTNGTAAKVANDSNIENNGYYAVVSGAWVQDRKLVVQEVEENNTDKGVSGKAVSEHTKKKVAEWESSRAFSREHFKINFVDVFPQTGLWEVPVSSLGIFTPTSSTSSTLTLSSSDAENIDKTMPLVCKMQNDSYYVVVFSRAEEGVITKIFDYGKDLDLKEVVGLMSLHDTVRGGMGQHLSPWGYKALAGVITEQSLLKLNYGVLGGFVASECELSTSYKDAQIRGNDGVVINPSFSGGWDVGGTTGVVGVESGGNIAKSSALIFSSKCSKPFGWSNSGYCMIQGLAGAACELSFAPTLEKCICRIHAMNPLAGDFTGSAKMEIYQNGELTGAYSVSPFMDYIDIPVTSSNFVIKFIINENKNTKIILNSVTFHYSGVGKFESKIITEKSVVAVLGSSNTQYPLPHATYINLVNGDSFNSLVEKPNGELGDGFGYYPKELAKITGATVDNWGSSGKTTAWGLEQIFEVLNTKRYTHILLTLFGNDLNTGTSVEDVVNNIRELSEYSKSRGVIPIVIMGYGTASRGQVIRYGSLHDKLLANLNK